MKTCQEIGEFLSAQPRIVELLEAVEALGLHDAWIGAGLVRNAVWDLLHDYGAAFAACNDVDVVYFDANNASVACDLALEARLRERLPDVPWEVRNQARMHEQNGDSLYRSTEDAIRCWPETATAIAARIDSGRVEVIAPYGVDDLVELIVRPTPIFSKKRELYRTRLATKDWVQRWPRLKFVHT